MSKKEKQQIFSDMLAHIRAIDPGKLFENDVPENIQSGVLRKLMEFIGPIVNAALCVYTVDDFIELRKVIADFYTKIEQRADLLDYTGKVSQ
jgi:hypothetical protein